MQKEAGSTSDQLVSTSLVSGIKFIQKMVALGQKTQETETERNRLMRDNTRLLQTITRLERERDKAKLEANSTKAKLDTAEESLNQALSEINSAKKAAYNDGYQKGFDATTASYVEQMPVIQDQIWVACWEACLTKVGVAEDSVLWVGNDLPSRRAAAPQEHDGSPTDDVDQQIDEFADVDEEIQMESQEAAIEHPLDQEVAIESNASWENATAGDGVVLTEAATNTAQEIQDLD